MYIHVNTQRQRKHSKQSANFKEKSRAALNGMYMHMYTSLELTHFKASDVITDVTAVAVFHLIPAPNTYVHT